LPVRRDYVFETSRLAPPIDGLSVRRSDLTQGSLADVAPRRTAVAADRHTAQQFTPDAALLVGSVPAGMSQRLSIPSSHGLIRCLMAPHGN
jgi:hypothetical protein